MSSTDPLLQLEYHRQFTHSLVFILRRPLCAIAFWLVRRHMSFKAIWLRHLLATQRSLLDAALPTGHYSGRFLIRGLRGIPFQSWTRCLHPLLGFVIAAELKIPVHEPPWHGLGSLLSIDRYDSKNELSLPLKHLQSREDTPAVVSVKPSFGNLLLENSL